MHKLWQFYTNWDKPLVHAIKDKRTTMIRDIQQLSKLTVDLYFQNDFIPAKATLLVFMDASTRAYRVVAFLTSGNEVTLVMYMNHVAPEVSLTLSKLELMATVVTSTDARFITDVLNLQDNSVGR